MFLSKLSPLNLCLRFNRVGKGAVVHSFSLPRGILLGQHILCLHFLVDGPLGFLKMSHILLVPFFFLALPNDAHLWVTSFVSPE